MKEPGNGMADGEDGSRGARGTTLRGLLPATYDAFLARHGRPRPIQVEAAAPLLAGRDVLLCAPSAAGKTEAFGAPLCERLKLGSWEAPAILVVSPTRALANDLFRRLEGPLHQLGIPLGRRTGEHREVGAGGRLQAVTILTPESLDSRLSRSPGGLETVRAIVLDELHILDGNPRGDQLRVLLSRLRHLLRHGLQAVAASATVADPEAMARRYLVEPVVVRAGGRRRLAARFVDGTDPEVVSSELLLLARAGAKKVLAFCNSRAEVERYAAALAGRAPFGDAVYAHHGSLAKGVRERAEAGFLARPRALCVATMTLELGIDIGDVDTVALLAPPPDVSSLVQRIGRGGRRRETSRAICFSAGPADRFRYRTLFELAAAGDLCAAPYAFRPSVLAQQAASLLYESRGKWVTAASLGERLPADVARGWDRPRIGKLLDHLGSVGWLEKAGGGRYVAGEKLERRWARGLVHSNISSPREIEVVDRTTGETIARLRGGEREGLPAEMRIGGRARRVVGGDADRLVVEDAKAGAAPGFASKGVPAVSMALAQVFARRLGVPDRAWPLVALPSGLFLFHFLGTAGGELLAAFLSARMRGSAVLAAGPLAIQMGSSGAAELLMGSVPPPSREQVEALVRRCEPRLARKLGMGPYHGMFPPLERARAVQDAAAVDEWLEVVRGSRVERFDPEADSCLWMDLASWLAG